MPVFTLNVSETLNEVSDVKKKLKDYYDTVNIYLNSTVNVDSVWRDPNTNAFITTVKKDRDDINEHIDSFLNYLNIIDNFCNNISQIVESSFNLSGLRKIEYNSDEISKMILRLDNCYELLNQNYKIFSEMYIPITFKYYFILKKLKNDTSIYMNKILSIKNNLINLKNKIENLISTTKQKVNRFNVKIISNNICEHSFKIINVNSIDSNNIVKFNI